MLVVLILLFSLSACSNEPKQPEQTKTPDITDSGGKNIDSLNTSPDFSYPFLLEDGTEKSVLLTGENPVYTAELHLAPLDDTGVSNRIILYCQASGTGVYLETAYVFNGETGEELPLTPPAEVLTQYLSVSTTENAWILHIGGADYTIDKSQFSDYSTEELYESPDFSKYNDFFVENGQLYCRVQILCAGMGTGYAKESLLIRYGYEAGAIIPVEITFCKSENAFSVPTAESIPATASQE